MAAFAHSARLVASMSRHNVRLLLADRVPLVVLIGMPLVVMAFLRPSYREALRGAGYEGASGAEQAVPGMTVVFAFLWIGFLAYTCFLEHHWRTWDRVRAAGVSTAELLAGKAMPGFLLVLVQVGVLLAAGTFAFGVEVRGSVAGLAFVATALAACVVAITLALVAVSGSYQQVNAMGALTAVLVTGVGGVFSPPGGLPAAVEPLAPASPAYWALDGLRGVMLDGASFGETLVDAAVLAGFAAVAVAFAIAWLGRRTSLGR